jgi:sec-independent protein translocase protein TatB
MFELSWAELMLVAVLALLIIGPKDLPVLFRNLAKVVSQGQRLWRKLLLSMQQLEREVNQSTTPASNEDWQQWLPEQLRHLPADYLPGSMTAQQHAERQAEQQRWLTQSQLQHTIDTPAAIPAPPVNAISQNPESQAVPGHHAEGTPVTAPQRNL